MKRGVTIIERETFESALKLGTQALEKMGFEATRAKKAAETFRIHNVKTLEELFPHRKDEQKTLSLARKARAELEQMFAHDAVEFNERQFDNIDIDDDAAKKSALL